MNDKNTDIDKEDDVFDVIMRIYKYIWLVISFGFITIVAFLFFFVWAIIQIMSHFGII